MRCILQGKQMTHHLSHGETETETQNDKWHLMSSAADLMHTINAIEEISTRVSIIFRWSR